jgi:hypothetical protein
MNCKLFLINMLSPKYLTFEINILLRPLMNCKFFLINMLTILAPKCLSRKSASCVLSPAGC